MGDNPTDLPRLTDIYMSDYTFAGDFSTERRGKKSPPYDYKNTLEMNSKVKNDDISMIEFVNGK